MVFKSTLDKYNVIIASYLPKLITETNIGHKYMDIEHDKRTYLFRKSLQLTYHCQRMTSWFPVKIVALSAGGQFVSPSTFSPMNSIFDCTNFFIPVDNDMIHATQIEIVLSLN